MSTSVATSVSDFLAHKRALGRKYLTEEATLKLLLVFCEAHGVTELDELTAVVLDAFVASRPRTRARSFNHLVNTLGCFLGWAVSQQRLAASPLRRVHRRETDRRLPFLFDAAGVRRLLEAAAALPDNSRAKGRGSTYHTVFALCYGLGLRAGEACGLLIGDIDQSRQLLVVRGGKFGKSRLVPYGPRIGELLARQVQRRGGNAEDPLFSFDGRRSVHPCSASQVFHRLVTTLGFPVPDGASPPVLHSLRHSFAVGCLLRWYQEGVDPQSRLFRLSTFMGHVSPESTAVYLTITPQLLNEASRRFEDFAQAVWSEETR
jgi:integrase